MEANLLLAVAGACVLLGFAAGWHMAHRRPAPAVRELPDEERLAWLQRLSTVGQMMSGVVHEVRTPLNTVILAVEHAQKIMDRGGDPREHLKTVAREAERAVDILSDILDFAKPSSLDLKPVELAPAMAAALDPLKIRFDERGVETSMEAPEGLRVMASERHFHQVLTIVLINALDAMPFGGRLSLKAERGEGGAVSIAVADTGVGIEPAELQRLFQPFATGKADSGGTGLGLNVARWIMNKHGGDVTIASEGIGKGTVVTVTLRSADAPAPAPAGPGGAAA